MSVRQNNQLQEQPAGNFSCSLLQARTAGNQVALGQLALRYVEREEVEICGDQISVKPTMNMVHSDRQQPHMHQTVLVHFLMHDAFTCRPASS
jgi:hypothetical protein